MDIIDIICDENQILLIFDEMEPGTLLIAPDIITPLGSPYNFKHILDNRVQQAGHEKIIRLLPHLELRLEVIDTNPVDVHIGYVRTKDRRINDRIFDLLHYMNAVLQIPREE